MKKEATAETAVRIEKKAKDEEPKPGFKSSGFKSSFKPIAAPSAEDDDLDGEAMNDDLDDEAMAEDLDGEVMADLDGEAMDEDLDGEELS